MFMLDSEDADSYFRFSLCLIPTLVSVGADGVDPIFPRGYIACPTPRERTEAARTAIRAVPATRQLPSSTQLRALLNALMRTPVGIVQQVGFVLMLFVSVLEASLPAGGAPPAASIADRAAATAVRSNTVVTTDERNRAAKIVAFAEAKRTRGDRFMRKEGEAVEKRAKKVKAEAVRRWVVRRNQKVQQLLRLLDATTEIGVDEALLVEYHAGGIEPREAGKVKSTPVTRENRDVFSVDEAHIIPLYTPGTNKLAPESGRIPAQKYQTEMSRVSRLLTGTLLHLISGGQARK